MGRAAAASGISGQRDPFRVDEGRALAELELAWADGDGFSAGGGTWCAVTSARDVLTGDTPDALGRPLGRRAAPAAKLSLRCDRASVRGRSDVQDAADVVNLREGCGAISVSGPTLTCTSCA